MAAYAATVTTTERTNRLGRGVGLLRGKVDVTNYNQTGAEITGITNQFHGGDPTVILDSLSDNGYLVRWNHTDKAVHAFYPTAEVSAVNVTERVHAGGDEVINLIDDDSAASNGVAVYAHIDEVVEDGSAIGHLEFVSPTNADTEVDTAAAGATVQVIDDDAAASAGTAIYFDEDGTDGSRLMFVSPEDRDVYIPLSNGEYIHITDNNDAASTGVQVYIDEDAAADDDKFLFVSPTDVDGTDTVTGSQTQSVSAAAGVEAANDVDVGEVNFVAFGRI